MTNTTKKGFTLVELLIVIAILGVLATAITVVLNPAELLAQARDGQRMSDLDTLRTALGTYVSQANTINLDLGSIGAQGQCMALTGAGGPFGTGTIAAAANTSRAVNGTGWVDVNFANLTVSPLGVLPVDPTNTSTYNYCYVGNNSASTFKLSARLESQKFRGKMASTADGGSVNGGAETCSNYTEATCWYDVGTNPNL